jgi:uncharacterized protein YyaL (SSP411 family)
MSDNDRSEHRVTNHLVDSSSPYLLSHAHNPVNWYPWGDEALNRARKLDCPIFLSIGYAACHWCHVMERESFEDEGIARILNENFVSIKVDREQRPDLDDIYMSFTLAMTGQGGWPMSVFLTPDLKPFFAGTYFPPDDRLGRPGFKKVIEEIAAAYKQQKDQIIESSQSIFDQVEARLKMSAGAELLRFGMIENGASQLMQRVDHQHGGFGGAPKFPHATEISLLLRQYRLSGDLSYLHAAEKALQGMADGGIFDHIGGGFSRYSVDERWLVPHFEKMLYDNALLVRTYAEAYQVTRKERYLDIVRRTLDFILREMTDENGSFYSAIDADSEGEEGKFYLWTPGEIRSILGDVADLFMAYYNVSENGNFEGKNILHIGPSSERVKAESKREDFDQLIAHAREKLLEARSRRPRPLSDDKTLTSWNGLMLSAMCHGFQVTGEDRYLEAARKNAGFVRETLYRDGLLTHAFRRGSHLEGQFLEDYGYYVSGLLDLYQSDDKGGNEIWLTMARQLADRGIELFQDAKGTLFLREEAAADLIVRPKQESDGALPAPGSLLINGLLKLHRITGENRYFEKAEHSLKAISGLMAQSPGGMASALLALDYMLGDKIEIVFVGNGKTRRQMLDELHCRYLPHKIVAMSDNGGDLPLFEGRESDGGKVRAYVCRNSVCKLPVSTVDAFKEQLDHI